MESHITLDVNDDLHSRLTKAAQYAGLVNANRLGLIDSMFYVMTEYEKMDRERALQEREK